MHRTNAGVADTTDFPSGPCSRMRLFVADDAVLSFRFGTLTHPGKARGENEDRYAFIKRTRTSEVMASNGRAFYEPFDPQRARDYLQRLEFCYTPKHGSWLNVAECELSCLTSQCLRGRRIGDPGIPAIRDPHLVRENQRQATRRRLAIQNQRRPTKAQTALPHN